VNEARDVIDFALKRRVVLADLAAGRVPPAEVCDAQPYLKLAARHYGEPASIGCPVCSGPGLRRVHYVYGDALGTVAGQAKHVRELRAMRSRFDQFTVYQVEVCLDCGWNHLLRTFVLDRDDPTASTASSVPTAADG
jgi:uncharacterized protein DUF5318